jgi:hypothetical protein
VPDVALTLGLLRGGSFCVGAAAGMAAGADVMDAGFGAGAVVLAVSAGAVVAVDEGLAAGVVAGVAGAVTGVGGVASVALLLVSSPAAHPVAACNSSVTRIGIANGRFIIFNIFSIPEIGIITGGQAACALIDMPSIIGK